MQDVICEEVYNEYYDSAGNYHWTGTVSGEHIIRAEGADMNKASNEIKVNEKEKVMFPEIVVKGTKDKPYYEIKYYDVTDKQWHLGYGSYNLEYVMQWKEECLEVVEGSITNDLCEKMKERLKEKSFMVATSKSFWSSPQNGAYVENVVTFQNAIEIVNQVEEEYKDSEMLNLAQMNADFQNAKLEELKKLSEKLTSSDKHVPEINVGESEETCEWGFAGDFGEWYACCKPLRVYIPYGVHSFKFCPYCGKKIKVV